MARQMKTVDSNEVRVWAQENDWKDEQGREVAQRGRMPSSLIAAYNKANKKNFKEYSPIARPVRGDNVTAEQPSVPSPRRSAENDSAPVSTGSRSVPTEGVNSLSEVISMLQAAERRGSGKGRPAVVTIQTLVNV